MSQASLAHIGYVVPRMDSALRRFEREGGVIRIPPTFDPVQNVWVCVLTMEDGADIELVAPSAEGPSPLKGRLARGGGLDHLCYAVPDLKVAVDLEVSRGGVVVCPPCFAVALQAQIAFVLRRSGLLVEFMSVEEAAADVR